MKRNRALSAILMMICVFSVLLFTAVTESADENDRLNDFDVNYDGTADISDVTALLNYLSSGCVHQPTVTGRLESTCVSTGWTAHRICAVCKEALEDYTVLEKTAHVFVVDEGIAPTCTEPGFADVLHCAVCGEVFTDHQTLAAAGHTVMTEAAVEPTCTEPGTTSGSRCSVCGAVFKTPRTIEPLGHCFGDWLTASEPTCTEPGAQTRVCAACGAIETQDVEALGHVYQNGVCGRCGMTQAIPQKGGVYTFGFYEQDNDSANGAEPIEWIVLDVTDGKALLLSKYALDAKPYNSDYAASTWETCTLRSWLNDDFFNAAFSSGEKARILPTELANEDNTRYRIPGGNDTTDRVFLLSLSDAVNTGFGFAGGGDTLDTARRCQPTACAAAQGCWTSEENDYRGNCWWWLRSPGFTSTYAAYANHDGAVISSGEIVYSTQGSVRPALWITL